MSWRLNEELRKCRRFAWQKLSIKSRVRLCVAYKLYPHASSAATQAYSGCGTCRVSLAELSTFETLFWEPHRGYVSYYHRSDRPPKSTADRVAISASSGFSAICRSHLICMVLNIESHHAVVAPRLMMLLLAMDTWPRMLRLLPLNRLELRVETCECCMLMLLPREAYDVGRTKVLIVSWWNRILTSKASLYKLCIPASRCWSFLVKTKNIVALDCVMSRETSCCILNLVRYKIIYLPQSTRVTAYRLSQQTAQ